MHADLSFEQAPPIGVPFRFFLTAPWFGVVAGGVLLWQGGDVLASRWTPGALALTHLLVLGFMLHTMVGALFQFVPVAAGGSLWRSPLLAKVVHPTFAVGTLLLCAGFLHASPLGLQMAAVLLFPAGIVLAAILGRALAKAPAVGATVTALRSAAAALAVTISLGALLVAGLTTDRTWPILELVNVHAAWGLAGWALLVLAGVGVVVVPMFQMTPPFPRRAAQVFPWLVIGSLLTWSGGLGILADDVARAGLLALLALAAAFFVTSLVLQTRRRRRAQDANVLLFRAAMAAGLSGVVLCAWLGAGLAGRDDPRLPVAAGVLLAAAFVFAINGMLYKIVPFLNWMHLKFDGGAGVPVPHMNRMIPAGTMNRQAKIQLVAFALLLSAALWPSLARPAGAALVVSFAWLGRNLLDAVSTYRRYKGQAPAATWPPSAARR